ncbi:hypothetical protein GGI11_005897 [Coemansia sp. RSA 2049]|nr:hypothetical protein H4217_008712 [Coemansia sp. RSA 1939]KAJ2509395.1 hypothetical protein GGI11_005897 [Coemansia sp. RSA 2049]KAJ2609640.1 hypothetical protein EV177_004368 [Coemansia sp. RSA 1804]KAJ2682208.1 hypothetical protein GGH99_004838 [Coemansia sp. RSA 1285]
MRVEGSYSVYPVRAIIVMGVGGCGKTTIGTRLAHLLGDAPFIDADALHSAECVEKMSKGYPLTDSDRWPWLGRVREEIEKEANKLVKNQDIPAAETRKIVEEHSHQPSLRYLYVVCACSSLKRSYRELLSRSDPDTLADAQTTHDTVFLHINVNKQELARRLAVRPDHFFGLPMLDLQLETLEPPDATREAAIIVQGNNSVDDVVKDAYYKVTHYITKNSL